MESRDHLWLIPGTRTVKPYAATPHCMKSFSHGMKSFFTKFCLFKMIKHTTFDIEKLHTLSFVKSCFTKFCLFKMIQSGVDV